LGEWGVGVLGEWEKILNLNLKNKKVPVVHDFMTARCHPETYAKDEG